jgi:hypothetical protein
MSYHVQIEGDYFDLPEDEDRLQRVMELLRAEDTELDRPAGQERCPGYPLPVIESYYQGRQLLERHAGWYDDVRRFTPGPYAYAD